MSDNMNIAFSDSFLKELRGRKMDDGIKPIGPKIEKGETIEDDKSEVIENTDIAEVDDNVEVTE